MDPLGNEASQPPGHPDLGRPFRAGVMFVRETQGVALGWRGLPRWGAGGRTPQPINPNSARCSSTNGVRRIDRIDRINLRRNNLNGTRCISTHGARCLSTHGARCLSTNGTRRISTNGASCLSTNGARCLSTNGAAYVSPGQRPGSTNAPTPSPEGAAQDWRIGGRPSHRRDRQSLCRIGV